MTNPQPPFLTARTVLILLTSVFFGTVFGTITFWSTGTVPSAVLAGLTATGVSVPVLRTLIH
ncbi:hypothetical protein [Streptomyces albipurpureus]|uniref:Uncharacterized protein n=1 Tax=Streptomyces albipurpureus TaxID=2897419 RepID=A0ABT0UMQ7_9ACTN|nr:hypothetical protein [Streptomyces sp. CWNU-1]MCM2388688.1 hypothetical protein [Streptomyces sp. CWNU-1]